MGVAARRKGRGEDAATEGRKDGGGRGRRRRAPPAAEAATLTPSASSFDQVLPSWQQYAGIVSIGCALLNALGRSHREALAVHEHQVNAICEAMLQRITRLTSSRPPPSSTAAARVMEEQNRAATQLGATLALLACTQGEEGAAWLVESALELKSETIAPDNAANHVAASDRLQIALSLLASLGEEALLRSRTHGQDVIGTLQDCLDDVLGKHASMECVDIYIVFCKFTCM